MLLSREEAKQEMKECEGVEECSMRFKIIDKIYDDLEHRTCENCKHRMNKGKNAELCLYGDTREFMWIPKHIFNSGCNKMDKLKEI